jgi:predicted DNA-binding transcriptional regulator AlpA
MKHDRITTRALSDAETSDYIGMSESWLRQSRMNRNPEAPPYVKIGRAVRYLIDDLDDWLAKRRRGAGPSNDPDADKTGGKR